ncbi:MAG TPA: hypothetical protein VHD62_05940 [Opitutaceae bacterium]|nr:hypothetical protein [Opitutaceae bacterium]
MIAPLIPFPASSARAKMRGSVLIVALILAAVVAISLTSFLKLALNASKLANRSFYSDGAQNLVDTGLEQALWSLNNATWSGANFSARSGHAGEYQGTFPSSSTYYNFSAGVKGRVKVWVDDTTSTPHAVAQATVTLADGTTFTKMAEAYMRKRSYFSNGLVARDTLNFVGNVRIDSWISNSDTTSTADDVAYSAGIARDRGQVASLRTTVDSDPSIAIGNADVYGYAAIATSDITDLAVGATGRLGSFTAANGYIDPTRVTYDFTTNFPDVPAPGTGGLDHSYTIAAITTPTVLPVPGDLPNTTDGKYYYTVPSIGIAGHDTITITHGTNVVLTVTGNVSSTGNSEIDIQPSAVVAGTPVPAATLAMYAGGDVSITGNGVVNGSSSTSNATTAFQLYGTRTAAQAAISGMQSFSIKGNGYLTGIVYAPNANVSVTGNGDTYGAVVANQVHMVGNGNFHYDESLANVASSNIWAVVKWRELSSASDRSTYSTQLSF